MQWGDRGYTSLMSCTEDCASELTAGGFASHHVQTRLHRSQKLLTIVGWPIFHQSVGSLSDSSDGQAPAGILEDENDSIEFT